MDQAALILKLLETAGGLYATAMEVREAARQSAALTPEQEAELDAKIQDAFGSPHWQRR